jgi:hypothetical protein
MSSKQEAEAVAEFIRRKGITRCPTACAGPTQASVSSTDQEELQKHLAARQAAWLARHPGRKQALVW